MAYPAAVKLSSAIRTSCSFAEGCFKSSWVHLSRYRLTLLKCCAARWSLGLFSPTQEVGKMAQISQIIFEFSSFKILGPKCILVGTSWVPGFSFFVSKKFEILFFRGFICSGVIFLPNNQFRKMEETEEIIVDGAKVTIVHCKFLIKFCS